MGYKSMSLKSVISVALVIGLAGSAMAGDEAKMKMAIELVGEEGTHAKQFMIKSDDLGFDLHEMQVGESRSIVDESGQNILVTRGQDGFSFNVDGETIELPDFQGGEHGGMHWIAEGDDDVNVHVMRDVNVTTMNATSGTLIVSPKPIDAATQQAIKSVLESAGYDNDVEFIDHDGAEHGKVMIKKVERVVENPQT
jgi:hypothetical protein